MARLTDEELRVALWDAIDQYVRACHGDPSKHVYGNTSRQRCVAEIEGVVFIAAARSLLPQALTEIEELRGELTTARVNIFEAERQLATVERELERYRRGVSRMERTLVKWAVAFGGHTPSAIVAGNLRDLLAGKDISEPDDVRTIGSVACQYCGKEISPDHNTCAGCADERGP